MGRSRLDLNFPVTVERLREIYSQATINFEYNRYSFSDVLSGEASDTFPPDIDTTLTEPSSCPPRPIQELIQRHFYWSATCFYRSFYLFLAYLVLDCKGLRSWAHVTAYYSRFYNIKALLNLFLSGITRIDGKETLIYLTMDGVKSVAKKKVKIFSSNGSHQIWWDLFDQMQYVVDFPGTDGLADFVLSDAYFNPTTRNKINYAEKYMDGFPELEWFDTSLEQMLSHLNMTINQRMDRDITDIDAYFANTRDEDVDASDFYCDEAQIIWHSILVYLEIFRSLECSQSLITREKIIACIDRFGPKECPHLCNGLRKAISLYLHG